VSGIGDERAREEFRSYLRGDLERFIRTLSLVPDGTGRLLEIGAQPHFTTLLLRRFRRYDLVLTNYYGDGTAGGTHTLESGGERVALPYVSFDLEHDPLPFPAASFDVTLCCEVIEHMTNDPLRALARVNESLRPGGTLVLSTPNATRVHQVWRALAGEDGFHDQFSAYGPYGRHNREYTPHEIASLLETAGFDIDELYTANVRPSGRPAAEALAGLVVGAARALRRQPAHLGEYTFVRAVRRRPPDARKPAWLYRSYPPGEVK
jgi:SAM-dependent methyltransferase